MRLCVDGLAAGELLPWYVRDHWNGVLHKLGVEVIPYARLFGADGSTVYFQHAASGAAMAIEETDTLVLSQGQVPDGSLSTSLKACATP